MIKREDDIGSLVRRHDAGPVDSEQFPQIGGEFDEVGFYDPLGDEVDHGQQQERFVRGAEFGCCRPAEAAGVGAECGEGF